QPDIIAVQEVQSDSSSTTASTNTIDQLLTHIANEGATVNYAYVDISPIQDAEGGAPGGNIRNGYLYNPARVALIAGSAGGSTTTTMVMNNAGEVAFSHNPGRVYP